MTTLSPESRVPAKLRNAGWFAAGLVCGVVLAIAVPFIVSKINSLVPDRKDPLDYVTIIDTTSPQAANLDAVLTRFDRTTKATWSLRVLERDFTTFDRPTLVPKAVDRMSRFVKVPPLEGPFLRAVATNAAAAPSVRKDGMVHVVWFSGGLPAKRWLWEDPTIFLDPKAEAARTTFQAGPFVVYYAPVGEVDHTAEIERFLQEIVQCPTDSGPCPVS